MTPRPVVLIVVVGLVGLAFGGLILIGILAVGQIPVPDILQNITVGAMTAIAGVLSRTSSEESPQQVEVVNTPQDPAQVEVA